VKIDNSIAAVVTGGASGLGEASARALAAKGAKVAIFDLNEERGEAVAKDIGGTFCKVDVSDEASVDAGFARARAAHGQERVLVCCAGIGTIG
jgi:NAD(P)-dependent dehydrogenase (short-subunit alcohol dehydrogenase family)